MARVIDIIDGLRCLHSYSESENPDQDFLGGADHDIIYGPSVDPEKMNPEDLENLERSGWFLSEEFDCWCHFC